MTTEKKWPSVPIKPGKKKNETKEPNPTKPKTRSNPIKPDGSSRAALPNPMEPDETRMATPMETERNRGHPCQQKNNNKPNQNQPDQSQPNQTQNPKKGR